MKFREYVGEGKVKQIKKKIVQTNIGPTEKNFLRKVARENPDGSKRNSIETYLGFGLNKKTLKRVFDYMKSWFIRYHLDFRPINPYLTLYILNNLPKYSILSNKLKKVKKEMVYKPRGTITVVSYDEKNYPMSYGLEGVKGGDYILIDYNINNKYKVIFENIFDEMNIDIIFEQGYVKLFEVESGILNHRIYEDMVFSLPPLPNLRLGNVGLLSKKYK